MRPIYVIAKEILVDWKKQYFGAVPYISAMLSLSSINDSFGADSARDVIAYFLANARTWKGEVAKRIKLELNQILKG
jgi:hypothetical protein